MHTPNPTDLVLSLCRFVCSRSAFERLLPGLASELPVPQDLGPEVGPGWALRPPSALAASLLEYVSSQVRAVLQPGALASGEAYFHQLETALLGAVGQAPGARLDSVIWLWLCDVVPRLLQLDSAVLGELERVHPAVVARHRAPLEQLKRLAQRSPAQHSVMVRQVLLRIDSGHELVAADLRQRTGESAENLLALVGMTPVLQLVPQDQLYSDLSLTSLLLSRQGFSDDDTFFETHRLVQAVIASTWGRRVANRAAAAERWSLDYFVTQGLVNQADRLDSRLLPRGGVADMNARVAMLGALQPDFADYVLHHSDQFRIDPQTAEFYGLREDQIELLADSETLSRRVLGYRDVVEELLRWDSLNAARSLVRVATFDGQGHACDGHLVPSQSFVLDLEEVAGAEVGDSAAGQVSPEIQADRFGALDVPTFAERPVALWEERLLTPPDQDLGPFGDLFASGPSYDLFDSSPEEIAGLEHYDDVESFAGGLPGLQPEPAAVIPGLQAASPVESPLSLLGVLEADFAARLRELEQGLRASPSGGARANWLECPDLATIFEDYILFPIGRLGEPGSSVGIARRHRDQLFDLHTFPVPDDPSWSLERALDQFMRAKVEANFVPLAFDYTDIPEGAGRMEPLTPHRLEQAFDRVARLENEI